MQADALGWEIMAQLKAAAGEEEYLQALVQAKQHATAMRRLRRKQQAGEVRRTQCTESRPLDFELSLQRVMS